MKLVIVVDVQGKDLDGEPVPDAKAKARIVRWATDLLKDERNNEIDASSTKGLWANVSSARVIATECEHE